MKCLLLLSIIFVTGCSSSKILSSWTAPEAGSKSYDKILVVSIVPNDENTRKKMEEHMVGDLKAIGYNAVSFLQTFDEKAFKGMRYDSVRTRFQREGIDGVITINLLAKEKETLYIEEKPTTPINVSGTDFWNYYNKSADAFGKPGYYLNSTQLYWESNFYDLNTLALLHHIQSTTFDPESVKKMAHQYGKKVVADLQKNYVLTAKRN